MLFCHITSHVETDADQELLSQKGGGGWPYIVVMDADGNVLSKHEPNSPRKTAGFRATVADAKATGKSLAALRKAAKDGDTGAAADLLEKQIELAHLGVTGARKQLALIRALPKARFQQLDRKILTLEVNEIQSTATDDEATQYAAGEKFAAMIKADRIPPDEDALYFWYFTSVYAEKEGNAELYAKALAGMRKHDRRVQASVLEDMEKTLEKLRDG